MTQKTHTHTTKAKFFFTKEFPNVIIYSDILILINFKKLKKILIATTDWKAVLSPIHIFLHNFPSHVIFSLHFENEIIAFFSFGASRVVREVRQSGEQDASSEPESENMKQSGHVWEETESFYGGKGGEKIKSERLSILGRKRLRDHSMHWAAKTTAIFVQRLDREQMWSN